VNSGPRILVVTKQHTGRQMASPGIRAYHIARVLAENVPGARVTLATPSAGELAEAAPPFRTIAHTPSALAAAVRESDIVVASRFPLYLLPLLYRRRVVLDMFTPFITESIQNIEKAVLLHQDALLDSHARDLMVQMLMADLILCATTRQRDLYFGMLSAIGRVTPDVYDDDHWLTKLLTLAPYGVRPGAPRQTRQVLKGVWPGISPGDTVLIWNGTIVDWYDTPTLIRAMHRVSQQRSDVKLFFLGTEHPDNPPASAKLQGLGGGAARAALQLCRELDVLDKSVFFNFDWVEYEDTANYLCEADVGVCTYFDNLETHYAFRSRVVDLLWAELPILCTQGDAWAELVAGRPLGIAVPERNESALANAILRLADDRAFTTQCKANLHREKEAYRWERALERLVEYCSKPAEPLRKLNRVLPLATTIASSFEAKLRLALYRRLDRMHYPWSRPHAPAGTDA
jgi:glycosyltransferase involved in cell wall biosynthesis